MFEFKNKSWEDKNRNPENETISQKAERLEERYQKSLKDLQKTLPAFYKNNNYESGYKVAENFRQFVNSSNTSPELKGRVEGLVARLRAMENLNLSHFNQMHIHNEEYLQKMDVVSKTIDFISLFPHKDLQNEWNQVVKNSYRAKMQESLKSLRNKSLPVAVLAAGAVMSLSNIDGFQKANGLNIAQEEFAPIKVEVRMNSLDLAKTKIQINLKNGKTKPIEKDYEPRDNSHLDVSHLEEANNQTQTKIEVEPALQVPEHIANQF